MIITLTGANSYILQQELHTLVSSFVAEFGSLALEQIDGTEADSNRLQESLTSLPFLANKKMVVLRTPGANKQFVGKAEKVLADLPETTELLIIEPKLDKRLTYYKFLKKNTDFREFNELAPDGLARWLVESAKSKQSSISSADARYLVDRVGTNQQLLASELEKLTLYSPQVNRETIDLLSEANPQSTIFQLLDAAFAGNTRQAMKLYAEQRALKVEPPQIIAMLTRQLHIFALIKTAGQRSPNLIAQEAKLNPYVVSISQNIAQKLTLVQLKKLIADLLSIDVRSKRTSISVDEALQHYLLGLRS